MTSKTTNKFSPEVRDRAVRMVLDHEREHASRTAARSSPQNRHHAPQRSGIHPLVHPHAHAAAQLNLDQSGSCCGSRR